jgi:release factor glutamine methyltransferase
VTPGRAHLTGNDTLRSGHQVMMQAFEQAGITSASTDARFLLLGILKLDTAALIRDGDRLVGSKLQELNEAVHRRLRHEPVSRILGSREFYGRSFLVTPDVLDPRSDTECLIDLVLDILRIENRLSEPLSIADVGVGSGAIIATLLAELNNARGIATDVSAPALEVARINAAALGVLGRLKFIETRGLDDVNDQCDRLKPALHSHD